MEIADGPSYSPNLYILWDLHIQKDMSLISRLGPRAKASGVFEPKFGQFHGKNENVPDPGLSLGTFVEQPSPRTAQRQSRFLAGQT